MASLEPLKSPGSLWCFLALLTRTQAQKGAVRHYLLSPVLNVPAAYYGRRTKAAAARLGVPFSKAGGGRGPGRLSRARPV